MERTFIVVSAIGIMAGLASIAISIRGWQKEQREPAAVEANATVDRRIHLIFDTRYDTDKRRTFECREVKP